MPRLVQLDVYALQQLGGGSELPCAVAQTPTGFVSFAADFAGTVKTAGPRDVPRLFPLAARDLRPLHEKWVLLTDSRKNSERTDSLVVDLLQGLGYSVNGPVKRSGSQLEVPAQSRGLCPVPQYGSRADDHLRVLCVWPQPGTDVLTKVLQETAAQSDGMIIFYLGRLDLAQRRARAAVSRQFKSRALILDETTLLFLCHQVPERRLLALFETALPFTTINPYAGTSTTVPPEMFVGRRDMVGELISFDGSCIVFGGRQLGKSALLEEARRQFRGLGTDCYAVRLDIKQLGDPTTPNQPEMLWAQLRDALRTEKFLSSNTAQPKRERIKAEILAVLNGPRPRKLLLLLDEADNFLDADARAGFEEVKLLRDLMTEAPHRFKVVLAGLHSVQRFQSIPNQPLAHFGLARLVGPLDPKDADELVRRPLESLGFRFESDLTATSVIRILSYTNYHPGLIQLFCRDLIDLVRGRAAPQSTPPFLVRDSDVDDVYRRPETRERIKDRFEWTLALDTRYQAIAWSLIVQQHETGQNYSAAFPIGEILTSVRDWWQAGFRDVDTSEMRSLLDEMVGLGVLVRTSDNRYGLRSPNVVRLLGSYNDIETKLLELANKASVHRSKPESDRITVKKGALSPLTTSQAGRVLDGSSDVSMVIGTKATQLEYLFQTLEKFAVREDVPEFGKTLTCPRDVLRTLAEWRAWLATANSQNAEVQRLFLFADLREAAPGDAVPVELIRAAAEFCTALRKPRQKRRVRIVLAAGPGMAWKWMSAAKAPSHDNVEMVFTKRWDSRGYTLLCEEVGLPAGDEEAQRRVLSAVTGGWPDLLQRYVVLSQKLDNEKRAADELEQQLKRGSPLAAEFWKFLELDQLPHVATVLAQLRDLTPETPEALAEFLEGPSLELKPRFADFVGLLESLGCVEMIDGQLKVERLVAEVLPL